MSGFETFCTTLRDHFQGVLSWKWDPRFNAVLTEFSAEIKEQIHKVINTHLTKIWDNSNLNTSPEPVQAVAKLMGGLMSNQLLLTSNPDQYPIHFCAWWPWGDGETISIRISILDPALDESQSDEIYNESKSWFGL